MPERDLICAARQADQVCFCREAARRLRRFESLNVKPGGTFSRIAASLAASASSRLLVLLLLLSEDGRPVVTWVGGFPTGLLNFGRSWC